MSDIRFNQWLHQSGTGGVTQISSGHVGIGTTNPLIPVHSANTATLNVGIITANNIYAGTLNGTLALSNISGITGSFTSDVTINGNLDIVDKIRHIGDTNTAIRFPANDIISFETAGNEKLRIASDSSLEIFNGSNSSTIKLKRHASTASEQAHIGYFSTGLHIETREATYLSLKTNTQERLRIDSVGKITTNTTGTIIADYNSSNSGGGYFQYDMGANGATIGYMGAASHLTGGGSNTDLGIRAANNLDIAVGGSSRKVFIYNSGNIQLNTTGTVSVDFNSSNSAGAYFNFDIGANGANIGYLGAGSHLVSGTVTADLAIRSTNNFDISTGGATRRLRITSDGKVVAGGTGAGYPCRLQSHGAGDLLDLNSTSGAGKIRFYESGAGRFNIETLNGTAGLRFYDSLNGVERLRIDSNGVVTKPSQPSFTARSTGTWSHGSSTGYLDIDINMVEEFDVGGNYNGQIFTAPVAGKYFFSYTFQYKCTSGYLVVSLRKGVSGSYSSYGRMHVYPPQQSTIYTGPGIIGIMDLAAGNTVKPVAEVNYSGNQIQNVNFSGYLLG